MAWDEHKNLAFSHVASPPSPASSGTTLTVDSGDGALFPQPPYDSGGFNCTVWPQGQNPTADNAEIIRVTDVTGDVFTFTRAQEGTAAIAIGNNFQIANTATSKVFEDIETAISNIISAGGGGVSTTSAELSALLVPISLQIVSVDARVTSVMAAHDVLSASVAVVSAAVASIDARATSLESRVSVNSAAVSVLSDRITSISAALTSLEVHASAASAAASVADAHASTASLAATSIGTLLATLSDRVTSISAGRTSIEVRLSTLSSQVSVVSIIAAAGGGVPVNMLSLTNGEAAAVSAGCPVYATASANTFRKADSSAAGTELVLGLVADVTIAVSAVGRIQTGGKLSLTSAQWSDVTSVGTGLTPGDIYYLAMSAGRLTTVEPTGSAVVHVVGQALSPNEMQLMLTPFDDETSAFSTLSAAAISVHSVLSNVSVLNTSAASVEGLQAALNALSNRISAGGGGGVNSAYVLSNINVASAQAASALADAISAGSATASNLLSNINVISNQLSAASAFGVAGLQSALNKLSENIAAGGATTDYVSAADALLSLRIASLEVVLGSISALSATGTGSVDGLQSVVNVLSGRIASVEVHASAASAAATSIGTLHNTLSDRVTSISAQLTSLEVHASAASAAATSVGTLLGTLSDRVTSVSAQLTSLEVHASAASAAATSVGVLVSTLSAKVTSISAQLTSIDVKASVISDRVTSISAQLTSLEVHASAASAAATSVDARVASLSVVFASLSVLNTAAVSVHGLQSILNAFSNRISAGGGGGATTAFVSALVDTASNTASAGNESLRDLISVNRTNISNQVSADEVILANHTSVLTNVSVSAGGTVVAGLQSVINAMSLQISALTGGGVTADQLSAGLAATSAQAASALADAISAGSATASNLLSHIEELSTKVVSISAQLTSVDARITSAVGRVVFLAADTNVSAAALTTIAGLSLALSIGGIYEMNAMVGFTTSTGQPWGFGLNFGGMAHAFGQMMYTNIGQGANQSTVSTINAAFDETATGSIILSSYVSVAGGAGVKNVIYRGVFVVSTSAPTPMHLLAKASTGTGEIVLKKGSYLRLYKLG